MDIFYLNRKISDAKSLYDELKKRENSVSLNFSTGKFLIEDGKDTSLQVEYIDTNLPNRFFDLSEIFYVLWDCTSVGFSTTHDISLLMKNCCQTKLNANLIIISSHGSIVLADCTGFFWKFRDNLTGIMKDKFRYYER
jgi:hypothetical protein